MARKPKQIETGNVIVDNASGATTRQLTNVQIEKYIRAWNSGMEGAYEALYLLYTGKKWSREEWAEFCIKNLRGVKSDSTARRLAAMVTNHQQIVHALPSGSDAKSVLDQMPDQAIYHLREFPAEVRAEVVELFAAANVVPSEQQVLEHLDERGIITEGQKKRLAKILAPDTSSEVEVVSPETLARNSISIIVAELRRLIKNNEGVLALGYDDLYALMRKEFNLVPVYEANEEWDEQHEEANPDEPAKDPAISQAEYEQSELDMMEETLSE